MKRASTVNIVARRASRVMIFTSAGAIAIAGCSQSAYGGCVAPDDVSIKSPCGFLGVTTTCAGATADCSENFCDVSPVRANCAITVHLTDGTTRTIDVTFGSGLCSNGEGVTPDFVDLTSSTCRAPTMLDAGATD